MLYYQKDIQQVLKSLETDERGLSSEKVESLQAIHGLNTLPEKQKISLLHIILQQFKSPLIYILVAAAVVALFMQEFTDAGFIFMVLFINALIGTYQEWSAEKNAASLQKFIHVIVRTKRDKKEVMLDAEQLVPGDIVLLESGNKVPADIRLITVNELSVDESFLTGEADNILKNTDLLDREASIGDRKNMVFAGSTVMTGRAMGVVVATGIHTEVGKIAEAVTGSEDTKAPLVIRMERFAKQVAVIVLIATALLAVLAIFTGMPYKQVFFFSIALAVSAIPEGLPIAITVALSIATNRMSKRNVIVRKLTAVEGLGSCTMIASDKTGTLTLNKQTLRKLVLPDGVFWDVTGEGYNGTGNIESDKTSSTNVDCDIVERMAHVATVCNEGSLTYHRGEWEHNGDAIDLAFLSFAHKAGVNQEELKKEIHILAEVPFESERKYSAVIYKYRDQYFAAAKGAMETLIEMCSELYGDTNDKEIVHELAKEYSAKGYRVLALAYATLSEEEAKSIAQQPESFDKYTLLGLAGFIDPLRPEAIESIELSKQAGVEVVMITGDHPLTAYSIASELGITDTEDAVITGAELTKLGDPSQSAFLNGIKNKRVFARVSPLQKMQLVQAFIDNGHFVAVTGDGVNDVPALKNAHIGVAMGTGTDLAKDTASILVTDDNFSSIVAGIEEGRTAYDNIRKVTYLLLSTGAAEVLLFFFAIVFGLPLPLTAIQILWLNLVTNGIQDKALAFEGAEDNTMQKSPRNPKEGLFNRPMIEQVVLSAFATAAIAFGAWYWLLEAGYDEFHARTLVFMLMVLIENVHVFNCRSEVRSAFKTALSKNKYILIAVLGAQVIHMVATQIPFMQNVLSTDTVSVTEWAVLLLLSLPILLIMEVYKIATKRTPKNLNKA